MSATIDDALGKLHRASCILGYVSENALNSDDVFIGETLKAAEELVLAAMAQMKEVKA